MDLLPLPRKIKKRRRMNFTFDKIQGTVFSMCSEGAEGVSSRAPLVPLASAVMCDSRPVRMVCWLSVTDAAPRTFFAGGNPTAGARLPYGGTRPPQIFCIVPPLCGQQKPGSMRARGGTHSKNTPRGNQFSACFATPCDLNIEGNPQP